jgi:L-cysteine S-thiosulfotransferase
LRERRLEIQDFPPYEFAPDEGRALFEAPFDDGSNYADCFGADVVAIAPRYPYLDPDTGGVRTLPVDINACRRRHDQEPLSYEKGDIAALYA